MDTQTNNIYQILIESLGFLTVLLILMLTTITRHLQKRLKQYSEQVTREIELIDQERSRISADLHDELGSGLSAVGLFLRQASEQSSSPSLNKALAHLQIQRQKLREIAHDLIPRTLETHGLVKALDELYEETREAGKLEIRITGTLDADRFHPAKSVHIYRIIREILTNTLKHAGAGWMEVHYGQAGKWLRLELKDNGSGFKTQPGKNNNGGDGLKNIQSRIEILKGTINFHSVINQGTTWIIRIPNKSLVNPSDGN